MGRLAQQAECIYPPAGGFDGPMSCFQDCSREGLPRPVTVDDVGDVADRDAVPPTGLGQLILGKPDIGRSFLVMLLEFFQHNRVVKRLLGEFALIFR